MNHDNVAKKMLPDHSDTTPEPKLNESDLRRVVAELARLGDLEYEHQRETAAKQLGVRIGTLDKQVEKARAQKKQDTGDFLAPPVPWFERVNGRKLLSEMRSTVRRHCILPEGADLLVALWCIQAHGHDALQISPILALQSPEKRCGKTTLLSVIGALVPKPLMTSNMSLASIFRMIDRYTPTLLLDEADTYMTTNEELRGLINGGHHKRSAHVVRVVGEDHEPRLFSVFAPKVISGIGVLPETMQDRAIVVPLRRKFLAETVAGFREKDARALEPLQQKASRWAQDHMAQICGADPCLPDALNDRAKDNAIGIAAIADLIGEEVGRELRDVLVANARDAASKVELGFGVWLLKDIREVLEGYRHPDISSKELIKLLIELEESPWRTYHGGRSISAKALAGYLREFEVKLHKSARSRFYRLAEFKDPFDRYLAKEP